jgi:hypothetical protein
LCQAVPSSSSQGYTCCSEFVAALQHHRQSHSKCRGMPQGPRCNLDWMGLLLSCRWGRARIASPRWQPMAEHRGSGWHQIMLCTTLTQHMCVACLQMFCLAATVIFSLQQLVQARSWAQRPSPCCCHHCHQCCHHCIIIQLSLHRECAAHQAAGPYGEREDHRLPLNTNTDSSTPHWHHLVPGRAGGVGWGVGGGVGWGGGLLTLAPVQGMNIVARFSLWVVDYCSAGVWWIVWW